MSRLPKDIIFVSRGAFFSLSFFRGGHCGSRKLIRTGVYGEFFFLNFGSKCNVVDGRRTDDGIAQFGPFLFWKMSSNFLKNMKRVSPGFSFDY